MRPHSPLIEPLEARIAPATIFVGNPSGGDTKYTDAPFAATDSNANTLAVLGPSSNTYFVKLLAGDKIELFNPGSGYKDFISIKTGTAVAFFVDDGDTKVQGNELSGLSLGKNSSITVAGSVNGDIVTNLADDGTIHATDLVSNLQAITSVAVTGGSVNGSIIAGGAINKAQVVGDVKSILTGNAANGYTYDFNTSAKAGGGQTLVVGAADGAKGQNIANVIVGSITNKIQSGDGGAGAVGGSLSNITLTTDTDGFTLQAGVGGSGNAVKTVGGAGGALTNIFINGPGASAADSTDNSVVDIFGGKGGDAFAGSKSNGGAGGKLTNVFVGYKQKGTTAVQNDNFLRDNIYLKAGDGGSGKSGGAAGGIFTSKVVAATPDNAAPTDEILAQAGAGGASTVDGGKGGAGGSITTFDARNLNPAAEAQTSDIHVLAGNGGTATAAGNGGAGGSDTGISLIGFEVQVDAGDGQDGFKTAGAGGSLKSITVGGKDTPPGVLDTYASLNAGLGGSATSGNGAKGGAITTVRIFDADFIDTNLADADVRGLIINSGTHANGGAGTGGTGAAGGAVKDVIVTDTHTGAGEGSLVVRSGVGGNGTKTGGAGGDISSFSFSALDVNISATAGKGGDASAGNAGKGGSFSNVSLLTSGTFNGGNTNAIALAGNGGVATGSKGSGGAGGNIATVNVIADGSVFINQDNLSNAYGTGGAGATGVTGGAAGQGGSITNTSIDAVNSAAILRAGDAGSAGTKSGKGGDILNSNVLGETNITILAGNGNIGGAGGNLTTIGYSGGTIGFEPTGTVIVTAGNGSGSGTFAGQGGSITGLTGYIGDSGTTTFTAGTGGGVATKGASGGSITNVSILGGGSAGVVFTAQAGDGGDAASASKGSKGGDVRDFKFKGFDTSTGDGVDPGVILRSIAAGDGGDASKTGGLGGSLDSIIVTNHDIGVRSGQNYGYATMGGLFAGVGGAGTTAGAAGNVTNVVADAISAIVAGKAASPQLVTKVDHIILDGFNRTTLTGAGVANPYQGDPTLQSYDTVSYATANLVGASHDPSAANSAQFRWTDVNSNGQFDPGIDTPLDGLIAAITLTTNRNFTPGAVVVPISASVPSGLLDYNV